VRSPSPRTIDSRPLRASDDEREQVVELLREHCAEGRLTPAELEERIDAAHAARTVGELEALTRDLPVRGPAPSDVLAGEIRRALRLGWRVEWRSDREVLLVAGGRPNHVLHAVLTLLTGVWLLVWIVVALAGGEDRLLVAVDESGEVRHDRIR
jgi:hypothetical protein